ncbi:unnamed protein product [Heterosigma akashiwo]
MGFSIWNLFKAGLLCTNAVAILHRGRFLSKYGLDQVNPVGGNTMKNQAVGLINAIQYLRVPLIAVNGLVIIFELILGG